MRLLQGFLVATLLGLIWLGWVGMWGIIQFTKGSPLAERLSGPPWFQTFNFWFSAFAWLVLACSLTARIIRIMRMENGRASDFERKKIIYQASRNWRIRGGESLIIVIAGFFGVAAVLVAVAYVWHVRTGESIDKVAELTAPFDKPALFCSFIGFLGFAIWLLRQESALLRAWRNGAGPETCKKSTDGLQFP